MADRQKREIRARMARTGERYTTARRHIVAAPEPTPTPDAHGTFSVVRAESMWGGDSELSGDELEERFNDYLDIQGNPWRLNLDELLLELDDGTYEVALEDCRTCAEVLDWITQISTKSWATDAVIAGLVRALELVLDPQTHLCERGKELGPTDWLPEDIEDNLRISGVL